jgi:hypothetical protein
MHTDTKQQCNRMRIELNFKKVFGFVHFTYHLSSYIISLVFRSIIFITFWLTNVVATRVLLFTEEINVCKNGLSDDSEDDVLPSSIYFSIFCVKCYHLYRPIELVQELQTKKNDENSFCQWMSPRTLLTWKQISNFNYKGIRECELCWTVAHHKVNKIPAKYMAHISWNLWAIWYINEVKLT